LYNLYQILFASLNLKSFKLFYIGLIALCSDTGDSYKVHKIVPKQKDTKIFVDIFI